MSPCRRRVKACWRSQPGCAWSKHSARSRTRIISRPILIAVAARHGVLTPIRYEPYYRYTELYVCTGCTFRQLSTRTAGGDAWHCLLSVWDAPGNDNTTIHEPRAAVCKHRNPLRSDTKSSGRPDSSARNCRPRTLRPRQSIHSRKQRLRHLKQNTLRQHETWLQVFSQAVAIRRTGHRCADDTRSPERFCTTMALCMAIRAGDQRSTCASRLTTFGTEVNICFNQMHGRLPNLLRLSQRSMTFPKVGFSARTSPNMYPCTYASPTKLKTCLPLLWDSGLRMKGTLPPDKNHT